MSLNKTRFGRLNVINLPPLQGIAKPCWHTPCLLGKTNRILGDFDRKANSCAIGYGGLE